MPRRRREKCENSIYHIIVRGNNKQDIFLDEKDKIEYLERLKRYQEKYKINVYAYCLMTNHVHLLIYDNGQDISKVMQGLNLSYVIYFNKRHNHCGHLFQDRFKSIMVKRDSYFIEVSKYIHLNPVKANMTQSSEEYKWSSRRIYLGDKDAWRIVDNNRILAYFSNDYQESVKLYSEYINSEEAVEEEIASTIEQGGETVKNCGAPKRIDQDRIIQILAEHFKVHRLYLTRKNSRIYGVQRDITIYITALVSRVAYKGLAQTFCVKPPAIGESIKRIINLMVADEGVLNEINALLKQVA